MAKSIDDYYDKIDDEYKEVNSFVKSIKKDFNKVNKQDILDLIDSYETIISHYSDITHLLEDQIEK